MRDLCLEMLGGDVAQLIDHRTGTLPTQVRFPSAARDFSPRVNFQCRLSYGVRTPPYAVACINICAHVKDPVVRVRVRWITETPKHPACTVGWVARLCRSWVFSRNATQWEKSHWDNTVVKSTVSRSKRIKPKEHVVASFKIWLWLLLLVVSYLTPSEPKGHHYRGETKRS